MGLDGRFLGVGALIWTSGLGCVSRLGFLSFERALFYGLGFGVSGLSSAWWVKRPDVHSATALLINNADCTEKK